MELLAPKREVQCQLEYGHQQQREKQQEQQEEHQQMEEQTKKAQQLYEEKEKPQKEFKKNVTKDTVERTVIIDIQQ